MLTRFNKYHFFYGILLMKHPQIHGIQLNIRWRSQTDNFQRVEKLIEELESFQSLQPNDLVVLPEMFSTGFDVGPEAMVEGLNHQLKLTDEFLSQMAQKFQVYIQGSGVSQALEGDFRGVPLKQNLVKVFNPAGQEILVYQKVHPFSFGGEHLRFESGVEAQVFDWNGTLVAPIICYDLRFPELFRQAVDLGAEVFTVVANWPEARQSHWTPLLQARAIENQAYVLGVNRSGQDPFLNYLGESVLYSPQGVILAQLTDQESILTSEVDLHELRSWRNEFPALQDRKLS